MLDKLIIVNVYTTMASGINFYSQLVISLIQIVISLFELVISLFK